MFRMLSTCRLVVISLAVSYAAPCSAVDADEPGYVAVVSDFRGSPKNYKITRGSSSLSPYPLQQLQKGDKVEVVTMTDKSGTPNTITLNINGYPHVIEYSKSWCVGYKDGSCEPDAAEDKDVGAKTSVWDALTHEIALVSGTLREASEDYQSARSAPLASRGAAAPPSLPILKVTPVADAPAGLSTLVIPISGGVRPFHVRLYATGATTPIAEQQVADGNEAHLKPPALAAGTYRVTIDDAANASVTETFAAVGKDQVPPPEPGVQVALDADQSFIRDTAFTVYAAYLKNQGPNWYLTAYQELQNTSPDFAAAQSLRFSLSEGP